MNAKGTYMCVCACVCMFVCLRVCASIKHFLYVAYLRTRCLCQSLSLFTCSPWRWGWAQECFSDCLEVPAPESQARRFCFQIFWFSHWHILPRLYPSLLFLFIFLQAISNGRRIQLIRHFLFGSFSGGVEGICQFTNTCTCARKRTHTYLHSPVALSNTGRCVTSSWHSN